jgi:hypothetical protein
MRHEDLPGDLGQLQRMRFRLTTRLRPGASKPEPWMR